LGLEHKAFEEVLFVGRELNGSEKTRINEVSILDVDTLGELF
jgi:hypothetical protein